MKLNIKNITIKDLIATVVVGGGFYLISKGIDGTVGTVLIIVIAFYFSHFRNHK